MGFYGIAYEILRRLDGNDVYTPFAHDLLLQRSLCFSHCDSLVSSLQEADLALHIIPADPASLFWKGFQLLKSIDRVDDAYGVFQQCVHQNYDWINAVEVTIAMFLHMHGHFD